MSLLSSFSKILRANRINPLLLMIGHILLCSGLIFVHFFLAAPGFVVLLLIILVIIVNVSLMHTFFIQNSRLLDEVDLIYQTKGKFKVSSSGMPAGLTESLNRLANQLQYNYEEISLHMSHADSLVEKREHCIELSQRYMKRFQSSGHAAFIYDPDGLILDVNDQACYMLEYSREELINSSFWDLYRESDVVRPHFAHKSAGEIGSLCYDSIFITKSDREIPVEVRTTVVDDQKNIMQCDVFDITQRHLIQKALEASEEKFRSFIETASDFMFMTNYDGNIIYTNPAMRYGLEYEDEDLLNKHLSMLMEINMDVPFSEAYHEIIAEEDVPLECQWKSRRGSILHGELSGSGFYSSDGEFAGFHGIFRDITYRKKLEESQRLSQLGRLSADVAHDIKNQLTVLFSISEMSLMEGTTYEELMENMETIQDECHRINDVVRRLLQFSRSGSGEHKLSSIAEVIDFVVKLLQKLFYQNSITVTCNYDEVLPWVKIDQTQMREVFMNILQNAVEAIGKEGSINISVTSANDFIKIQVKDDGPGIPANLMEKIFDPFFTTKETGTGLGVSACYGIITAHGGDLLYTSTEGEGTTVTMTLPVVQLTTTT